MEFVNVFCVVETYAVHVGIAIISLVLFEKCIWKKYSKPCVYCQRIRRYAICFVRLISIPCDAYTPADRLFFSFFYIHILLKLKCSERYAFPVYNCVRWRIYRFWRENEKSSDHYTSNVTAMAVVDKNKKKNLDYSSFRVISKDWINNR